MFARVVRYVLATGFALAVWAIATPARAASAPYCDDRGASASAPPPVLDAPDVAIQRAHLDVPCPWDDSTGDASVTPGHDGTRFVPDAPEPALLSANLPIIPLAGETLLPPDDSPRPTSAVRSRVERPPRG